MLIGPMIAQGRTAEVYAFGEDRVLKLLRPDMPAQLFDEEVRMGLITNALGLAAPRFYGALDLEGQHGIIYERIGGETMLQAIARQPWTALRMARMQAELHAGIHTRRVSELPSLRDALRWDIEHAAALSLSARAYALASLERLPDGDCLCHRDLHPGNIMLAPRGRGVAPVVIDWMSARRGDPAADLARSLLMLRAPGLPEGTTRFDALMINALRRLFASAYLRRYRQLNPQSAARAGEWTVVVAAARVMENISSETPFLVEQVERAARAQSAPA